MDARGYQFSTKATFRRACKTATLTELKSAIISEKRVAESEGINSVKAQSFYEIAMKEMEFRRRIGRAETDWGDRPGQPGWKKDGRNGTGHTHSAGPRKCPKCGV